METALARTTTDMEKSPMCALNEKSAIACKKCRNKVSRNIKSSYNQTTARLTMQRVFGIGQRNSSERSSALRKLQSLPRRLGSMFERSVSSSLCEQERTQSRVEPRKAIPEYRFPFVVL